MTSRTKAVTATDLQTDWQRTPAHDHDHDHDLLHSTHATKPGNGDTPHTTRHYATLHTLCLQARATGSPQQQRLRRRRRARRNQTDSHNHDHSHSHLARTGPEPEPEPDR
jgi:hypothetical protein